jgi:hypothetical protein
MNIVLKRWMIGKILYSALKSIGKIPLLED